MKKMFLEGESPTLINFAKELFYKILKMFLFNTLTHLSALLIINCSEIPVST